MKLKQELNYVIELIRSGKHEEAGKVFMDVCSPMVLNYLQKFRWTEHEALEMLHDCYFIIEDKVNQGLLNKLNTAYVKKTCKLLGANRWRKDLRKQNEYLNYLKEAKKEMQEEYKQYAGIELFGHTEKHENKTCRAALRAFDLLAENCREIIRYKHVKNYGHKQICQAMPSINNENSSKTILNRCMKQWRKWIDKISFEEKTLKSEGNAY